MGRQVDERRECVQSFFLFSKKIKNENVVERGKLNKKSQQHWCKESKKEMDDESETREGKSVKGASKFQTKNKKKTNAKILQREIINEPGSAVVEQGQLFIAVVGPK